MFYRALTDEQTLRVRRARPVMALAAVAFAIGVIVGANGGGSSSASLAGRFVAAWSHGDYAAMYAEIDAASRHSLSADQFASDYREAMRTATATSVRAPASPAARRAASWKCPCACARVCSARSR